MFSTGIAFVDTRAENYPDLIAALPHSIEIHILDVDRDGLSQILEALAARTGLGSLHIISHGSADNLLIGQTSVSTASLDDHRADLARIAASLTADAEILLYGSDASKSSVTDAFVDALAAGAGLDLASTAQSPTVLTPASSMDSEPVGFGAPVDVGSVDVAHEQLSTALPLEVGAAVVPSAYLTLGGKWGTSGFAGTAGGTVTWTTVGAGWGDSTNLVDDFGNPIDLFAGVSISLGSLQGNFYTLLSNAFAAWSAVANINFRYVADLGGDFGIGDSANIRIGAAFIDGSFGSNILGLGIGPGYNTFGASPQNGDLIFDSGNTWSEDLFYQTALHEIGHSLGLDHSYDSTAVMYYAANGQSTLQADDIAGIQSIYGPRPPPNTAPTVIVLAGSSYPAGTVLTGSQLFAVTDPEGTSDIGLLQVFDADTTGGAVWRYNGAVINPGSTGYDFSYGNRNLLTYTVGTGTNDFQLRAIDFGLLRSNAPFVSITGTTGDDYAADTSTTGTVAINGRKTGYIETVGDQDWFRVSLSAGSYAFNLDGNTLSDPFLYLYDASGNVLQYNDDANGTLNSEITYHTSTGGTIYLGTEHFGDGTGSYTVRVASLLPEITVLGNGVSITRGDSSPSSGDFTDFGTGALNSVIQRTFTVRNDGPGTLTTSSLVIPAGFILTEGLSTLIAPGASDTFTVQLDSSTAGTKEGLVQFATNDTDESIFAFSLRAVVEPARPDFTASSLTLGATSLAAGGATSVSFAVANVGPGGGLSGTASVYLSTDSTITTSDTRLNSVVPHNLNAGETQQFNDYRISLSSSLAVGTYYVGVIADDGNMTAESNEANNVSNVVTLTVTPAPLFTDGNDTVTLTQAGRTWSALGGDDVVTGTGGADTISGGAGADTIIGGDGLAVSPNQGAVYRLYDATLDRAPDVGGFNGWVAALDAGTSLVDITSGFVNSAEFRQTYGDRDNTQFVALLYDNVLGRAPDSEGLASWVNALAGGSSRESVVNGFSQSQEFIDSTALATEAYVSTDVAADAYGQVYRLYGATLARQPDAGGFEAWVNTLASGQSIASITSGFVNSREFQATYGALDNTQFVTLLYDNVLDRAPDSGGLSGWVASLQSGNTRENVVKGFSESAEYQSNTAAALRNYMITGVGQWSDWIDGNQGNDRMFGGRGADTFAFDATEVGTDLVYGIESWDTLQLTGFGYADSATALSHMVQSGGDVVFSDLGQTITFHGATIADLRQVNWVVS